MGQIARWMGRATVAAAVLFAGGFAVFVNQVLTAETRSTSRADGIVALTGDGERIEEAAGLLAQGWAQRLLISGVNKKTTRAALEKLAPQSHALFDCCIDIGYIARDTIGNAAETRDWVAKKGFNSLIVVTSDYHMPRSLIELERVMPGVRLIPHATPSRHLNRADWWANPETVRVLLAEYVKLLPATARLAASRIFEDNTAYAAEHKAPVRASTL